MPISTSWAHTVLYNNTNNIHSHPHVDACTHTHMRAHAHTHTHMHTHMHTHTHAHTLDTLKTKAKLQALVNDIHPSTTAVCSYAIGSRKLSANVFFFVGAQTVVSLLQTDKIRRVIYSCQQSYTSTNKTTIV